MLSPKNILQEYWGFDDFRNPQEAIIESVLNGNNTIALLPTGGGKSICFQIPALVKEGVCIVISPLIALMEDQVTNLKAKNIKATLIPSGMSEDDMIILFDTIRFGKYKFLYISPERLQSKFIQQKLAQLSVNLIAIDEAHCISEWGHDFRPAYKKVNLLREIHPNVNCIALTATATPKVLQDIKEVLDFEDPILFKKSFERNNLAYQIYYTEDKLQRLEQIFTKTKGSAIIYTNTRNSTKELSNYLNNKGFTSTFYHAGLSSVEKKLAFTNWMEEKTPIIVATNAFGMGIDKDNVKIVVHYNLPNSIENYIQEAGRAGRNGKKAFAVLLTNKSDIALKTELDNKAIPSIDEIKYIHKKLYQYFQIALGDYVEDTLDFNLLEFCNRYEIPSNKTFNTLQILNNNSIISFNTNSKQKSSFRFIVNSKQVIQYKQTHNKLTNFIDVLLRLHSAFTEQNIKIDEFFLGKKAGITSWQVIKNLEKMENDEVIVYTKRANDAQITLLVPREDDKSINRIQKNIKTYLTQKTKKTNELIQFVENNELCRNIQLLSYFGETNAKACNTCDVCLDKKKRPINITKSIIQLLNNNNLNAKEISRSLNCKEEDVLINLRYLLSEEKIGIDQLNKFYLK